MRGPRRVMKELPLPEQEQEEEETSPIRNRLTRIDIEEGTIRSLAPEPESTAPEDEDGTSTTFDYHYHCQEDQLLVLGTGNLDLPPSPPPLPPVSEPTVPDSDSGSDTSHHPLSPLLPSFLAKMPKSITMGPESGHGHVLYGNAHHGGSTGDEFPSQHETVSGVAREKTPDVLLSLSETVAPATARTKEPPAKKSRTIQYTPDRSTEASQLDVDTDPLVNRTTETVLARGKQIEAPQADAMKDDDKDSSDRPSKDMAPPSTKTQGSRNVIPVNVYAVGEVWFYDTGAEYSIPARFTFPGTKQTTFREVRNEIYNGLKLPKDKFSLRIQARYNAVPKGSFFFTLLAINDDRAWRLIFDMAVSGMNWRIIELYVKPVPKQTCQNVNPNLTSSSGTSSIPQWSLPMHTTPVQNMPFNSAVQGSWPGFSWPPPLPFQTCQNHNSNPTTLPGTTTMAQQTMPTHVYPSQNMPYNSHTQASCSRPNPILSSFHGMSSRAPQNMPMHAKPSQTKQCNPPTQGSCMRPPPISNHPNPIISPGTNSVAQQSMPMHINPSQSIADNSHGLTGNNTRYPHVNNSQPPVLIRYPAYNGSLSVDETFESKEHLKSAIKDFHIRANIEVTVKSKKKIVYCWRNVKTRCVNGCC